jgi:hypothetical protein
MAAAVAARDGLGHGGQGGVDGAPVGKAAFQDLDLEGLSLVEAGEER